MQLQKKLCDVADVKLYGESDGPGSFSGYASTRAKDRAGEIVARGAFKNLGEFERAGFIAVGHDWSALPIATIKSAVEDDHGLLVEGDFHSTPAAQAARRTIAERLERGKDVGLSIGYRVREAEDTPEGRLLKDIELHEVSIVTVPCNAQAMVAGVKDLDGDGSHGGLRLGEQVEAALAAAETFDRHATETLVRLKAITEDRAKAGRVISATNVQRIDAIEAAANDVLAHCGALRDAAKPKAIEPGPESGTAASAAFAVFQQTQARLNGVLV